MKDQRRPRATAGQSRLRSRSTAQASGHRVRGEAQAWWRTPTAVGGGALGVVVIVAIIVVLIAQGSAPVPSSTAGDLTPVTQTVLNAVTQPDGSTLAAVGGGGQPGNLTKLPTTSTLRDAGGQPLVAYVGAEYCPFCAAERWSLIIALSRFGSFTGLQETRSAASPEVFPNTSTLTFVGATYRSSLIAFQPTELQDRNHQTLQTPSAVVAGALEQYDTPPYTLQAQQIPFLDIAGEYVLQTTSFSPQVLRGLSWSQIATQLAEPASAVARAVLGNANILSAAICAATGNQAQAVCSASYIKTLEAALPS